MKKLLSVLLSATLWLTMTGFIFTSSGEDALVDQVQAGVVSSYSESTQTINQPDAGYSDGIWMAMSPGKVVVYNPTSFSVLFVNMGNYSAGYRSAHGLSNETLPLDQAFFDGLEATLQNAKNNGVMLGLRFRYDDLGTPNPEPASWQQVLDHLQQIEDSGLLETYADVLSYVETGTVGQWGEQHGGLYTSKEYVAELTDVYLDMVPESIQVSVRRPLYFMAWLQRTTGQTVNRLKLYNDGDIVLTEAQQARADRIGLYNDGYMGSINDLGTFNDLGESTVEANRNEGLRWLFGNLRAQYGGEYSGNYGYTLQWTTWQPMNAIPEMYYSHVWNINGNIYKTQNKTENFATLSEAQARKTEVEGYYTTGGYEASVANAAVTEKTDGTYDVTYRYIGYDYYTFTQELAQAAAQRIGENMDLSAYYGLDCYKFIRDHLGYRLVLRDSKMTGGTLQPGGSLTINLDIENTGFSNIIKEKQVELILVNGTLSHVIPLDDVDPTQWLAGQTAQLNKTLSLPENISGGDWQVYLRISPANDSALDDAKCGSIFANEGIFNSEIGANLIGRITVNASTAAQGGFVDTRPAGMYYSQPVTYPADADNIQFINQNYVFKTSGLYGYTILFKVDGIAEGSEINLTRWSAGGTSSSAWQLHAFNFFFHNNPTYTYGKTLTENGYYLMYCPFYSIGGYGGASVAGETNVSSFKVNDTSTQREDKNTPTSLNGNAATITPLGIIEGAVTSYQIAFAYDGTHTYTGSYSFVNTDKKVSENVQFKTGSAVLDLYDGTAPVSYTESGIKYNPMGWTTQGGYSSGLVSSTQIAVGTLNLQPYYEVDLAGSGLNAHVSTLTGGKDEYGVTYTLNSETGTALVGNGSSWYNNSGFSGAYGDCYVVPAYVVSGGLYYEVTGISNNAFRSNTYLKDIYIPDTVTTFGAHALGGLAGITRIYCYQNSPAAAYAQANGFQFETAASRSLYAAVFKDGDGHVLAVQSATAGQTVTYTGAQPTKTADHTQTCDYLFTGWSPALTTPLSQDTVFEAQFDSQTHAFVFTMVTPATETTAGLKKATCSRCGYEQTITIAPLKYGDANGDGYINVADLIILRRYLAQGGATGSWDLTAYNLDALDVDCDANLTQADLTLLTRYIENWENVTIGPAQ